MQPDRPSICVLKLGGSLFDLPDLFDRLDRLLLQFADDQHICLVPGGGRFADEVRRLDSVHHWPIEQSHRLAIQTMKLSAQMLHAMEPRFELVDRLDAVLKKRFTVLDVSQLPELADLSAGWETTSDTISAHVAGNLAAYCLSLLKSTELGNPVPSTEAAGENGHVDANFARAAAKLPLVRWANLRADQPVAVDWLRFGREASRG